MNIVFKQRVEKGTIKNKKRKMYTGELCEYSRVFFGSVDSAAANRE